MDDAIRTPSETVGARVRSLREEWQLSQRQVAERMKWLGKGWTGTTVSNVEAGKRPVSVDELFCLAVVLGVRPQTLFEPRSPGIALGGNLGALPAHMVNAMLNQRSLLMLDVPSKGKSVMVKPLTEEYQRFVEIATSFDPEKED